MSLLKRLVTVKEFVENSTFLGPDNVNVDLDISSAFQNFNNLSDIDQRTIRLQQYLDQAGKQVDSLSNGIIYNMWDYMLNAIANPDPIVNTSDAIKNYEHQISTIKYVIIRWVETFIQSNQLYIDATVPLPSNMDLTLEGNSKNADIEITRLDLINILNTTFFFNKIESIGSVEDKNWNPYEEYLYQNKDSIDFGYGAGIRFKSGELVKDVDYLGLENKARLDTLEPKIEGFQTQINQNAINIKQLQDLTNTHTRDISTLKQKTQQNTDYIGGFYKQYTQWTTNHEQEYTSLKQQVDSLSSGFRFRGDWNNTTTYNKNDSVSHNGSLWVSNLDNNLGIEPTTANKQYWTDLGSAFQSAIDSSILKLKNELQPQITNNANDIVELQNQTANFEFDLDEIREDLNQTKSQVETNKEDIASLTQKHNDLETHLNQEVDRLEEEIKVTNDRIDNISIDNMVTTDTPQDITAIKTFKSGLKVNDWTLNDNDGSLDFKYGGNTFSLSGLGTSTFDNDIVLKKNMVSYVQSELQNINLTNYLNLTTTTKQEVQGPVNFTNLTVNNDRVLTTSDLGDTSQFVTTNTAQTITGQKTFDIDTNIAANRKLIFKGSRDLNLENNNGFLNINSGWGILFNRNRGANYTSVLQNHIETPYINIGSGDNQRYRLAKSGDNLNWDNKPLATQEFVNNAIANIPSGDNYAKLNQPNTFTSTFNINNKNAGFGKDRTTIDSWVIINGNNDKQGLSLNDCNFQIQQNANSLYIKYDFINGFYIEIPQGKIFLNNLVK